MPSSTSPHRLQSSAITAPAVPAQRTVVVLAATPDRLNDLSAFFRNVDASTEAVHVLMIDASHQDMVRCLLAVQQATDLPVQWLSDALAPRRGHLYVVPDGRSLRAGSGWVKADAALTDPAFVNRVDESLTQLAYAYRDRLIAVAFLEEADLAAPGWQLVRRQGGVVMTACDTAASTAADASLPASRLPARIRILSGHADRRTSTALRAVTGREPDDPSDEEERAWSQLLSLLTRHTRHDFERYGRRLLLSYLERRMRIACVADLAGYLDFVRGRPSEADALLAELVTGGPSLLAGGGSSGLLDRSTCAGLIELAQHRGDAVLRVWNVDCAHGEDAYAIAVLLIEASRPVATTLGVRMFATDADPAAVGEARLGIFPAARLAILHKALVDRYFTAYAGNARAGRTLRDAIVFAVHDLHRDPPISKVHLVVWRHRLSQLSHSVQRQLLELMRFALAPGGYLLLGEEETSDALDEFFVRVERRQGLYRARALDFEQPAVSASTDIALRPPRLSRASTEILRRSDELDSLPSLIVSKDLNVLHLCDRVGRYLIFVDGDPSRHVLSVVDPGLQSTLRAALQDAIGTRSPVFSPRVPFRVDGKDSMISLAVKPFTDSDTGSDMLLVLFDETSASTPAHPAAASLVSRIESRLDSVQVELRVSQPAHADSASPAWQVADEALKVVNEELRTATEELRSREAALQIANESLVMRIAQLERGMAAAGLESDHLHNFCDVTDEAVMFTDRNLIVRFHTRPSRELLRDGRSYNGRLVTDVLQDLDCPTVAAEAVRVMRSLQRWEQVVSDRTGRRIRVRLTPYVRQTGEVSGVAVMLWPA